jgi:hypothetical protein
LNRQRSEEAIAAKAAQIARRGRRRIIDYEALAAEIDLEKLAVIVAGLRRRKVPDTVTATVTDYLGDFFSIAVDGDPEHEVYAVCDDIIFDDVYQYDRVTVERRDPRPPMITALVNYVVPS